MNNTEAQAPEFPDYCPTCRVHGSQACVAEDGITEVDDHAGRPIETVTL